MKILNRILILSVSVCFFLFVGCGSDIEEKVPDVSHISLDNEYVRWDQLIAQLDTNRLEVEIEMLKAKYPEYYDIFFKNILPFEAKTKEEFLTNLQGYLSDSRIQDLQDTTALIFADFDTEIAPKLDQAMKVMKHYFPEFIEPNFYTFTSEFTYQQFIFPDKKRDGIGIGLDMFLGSSYPYKELDPNNPAFSNYLTRAFNKKHLVKKVVEILVDDQLGRPSGSRLLDQMIHNGKKLYILDKILPSVPDSIILEYSEEQTNWVKENEIQIWAFFFDKDMFYESNSMKINKYINPSPSSPGMPENAPGRTANYIGLQIVKAYMKRNSKLSLVDLIAIKDNQKIMDGSKYKPKRK